MNPLKFKIYLFKYSIFLHRKQSPFYVRSAYPDCQGRVVFFRTEREKISYNKVTVKGTAASRVFCRLKAEAVE